MTQRHEGLQEIDDRIAWILDHPGMSPWLKTAFRTALDRDPIAVINDLEILSLLRLRCAALTGGAFAGPGPRLGAGDGGSPSGS